MTDIGTPVAGAGAASAREIPIAAMAAALEAIAANATHLEL